MEMKPLIVRADEAARMLGIGKTNLYTLVGSGAITARKLGKKITVFEVADLERYVASLPAIDPALRQETADAEAA